MWTAIRTAGTAKAGAIAIQGTVLQTVRTALVFATILAAETAHVDAETRVVDVVGHHHAVAHATVKGHARIVLAFDL